MRRPQKKRTQIIDAGGVEIHQLLCGREIANKRAKPPADGALWRVWEFAESMRNFVYLVVDVKSREALVFDGCWDIPGIFEYAAGIAATIVGALYSHAHFDHAGGSVPTQMTGGVQLTVAGLRDFVQRDLPVWAGESDVAALCTQCGVEPSKLRIAEDGECIHAGTTRCTVFASPGHTPGSLCLHVASTPRARGSAIAGATSQAAEGVLLSGDTLFVQSCGRTDTPEGSQGEMLRSLSKLCEGLPRGCIVCPGHDYAPDPYSTVGAECSGGNQMVSMALQQHGSAPGVLPEFLRCSCRSRARRTAADLLGKPALDVACSTGPGTLALDGIPFYATAGDLRKIVCELVTARSLTAQGVKAATSHVPEDISFSDLSTGRVLEEGELVCDARFAAEGLAVRGAELPEGSIRRPWFMPGCEVVLEGLRSSPELNGQLGSVSSWDQVKGRYDVLLESSMIRARADNMRPSSAPSSAETWRVVFKDKVAVRAEASVSARILGARKPGALLCVAYEQSGWVRLHADEGFGQQAAWVLVDASSFGLGVLVERCSSPSEAAAPPQEDAALPPPAAAAATGSAATQSNTGRLRELTEELERVEMEKAAAVEEEDFDAAAAHKKRQKELEEAIREMSAATPGGGAHGEQEARLRELADELARVEMEKAAAVEEEDFDAAAALKKRQNELVAAMQELSSSGTQR